MRFNKKAICTGGNGGFSNSANQLRVAAGDATGLVRLLQAMRAIHYYRYFVALHNGYIAVINNQILVAKTIAALCKHGFIVAGLLYFINSKFHRFAAYKLAFLYVYNFACF